MDHFQKCLKTSNLVQNIFPNIVQNQNGNLIQLTKAKANHSSPEKESNGMRALEQFPHLN